MLQLRNLVPAALRPTARQARAALRSLRPVAHTAPLDANRCEAALKVLRPFTLVECGAKIACDLELTNHSTFPVAARGSHPVGVAAEWRAFNGERIPTAVPFAPLPRTVQPGETAAVTVQLAAPTPLGDYELTLSVAQFKGAAFRTVGPAPRLDVQVTNPAHEDINYAAVFAASNLADQPWGPVGPSSMAEFERLQPVKLRHLIDAGLTPDSKLLDVGCGTGLLAAAAETYLSDRGLYYGTDVGKEGVEYCKARYRRPNFRFAWNPPTRIPIDNVAFDAISYYSVFTHTYADETALLLAESKRLLAPTGFILADVFTSPLVERFAGNRCAVELNREHLLRLADAVGLKAELLFDSPWKERARREFFRFTHKSG